MNRFSPQSCFGCEETHDLQPTEALGQLILLCKDCLIDWKDSNTQEDVIVQVTFQKLIDQ